jgi:hypothetical protein
VPLNPRVRQSPPALQLVVDHSKEDKQLKRLAIDEFH